MEQQSTNPFCDLSYFLDELNATGAYFFSCRDQEFPNPWPRLKNHGTICMPVSDSDIIAFEAATRNADDDDDNNDHSPLLSYENAAWKTYLDTVKKRVLAEFGVFDPTDARLALQTASLKSCGGHTSIAISEEQLGGNAINVQIFLPSQHQAGGIDFEYLNARSSVSTTGFDAIVVAWLPGVKVTEPLLASGHLLASQYTLAYEDNEIPTAQQLECQQAELTCHLQACARTTLNQHAMIYPLSYDYQSHGLPLSPSRLEKTDRACYEQLQRAASPNGFFFFLARCNWYNGSEEESEDEQYGHIYGFDDEYGHYSEQPSYRSRSKKVVEKEDQFLLTSLTDSDGLIKLDRLDLPFSYMMVDDSTCAWVDAPFDLCRQGLPETHTACSAVSFARPLKNLFLL